MNKKLSVIVSLIIILIGCSSPAKVSRVGVDTTIDLSGKWNDADARMVAQKIVPDLLNSNWLFNYVSTNGKKPVVIVGYIGNETSEHINVETFCRDIEQELINSGKVKFAAGAKQREEVRKERLGQQTHASEATAKRLANELGADFMLKGTLSSIEDSVQGKKVVYYQINLELINLETNEIVWMGSKKIKKVILRSKHKW